MDVYVIPMTSPGYDTGNVQSWLDANVAIALQAEKFRREPMRRSQEAVLG